MGKEARIEVATHFRFCSCQSEVASIDMTGSQAVPRNQSTSHGGGYVVFSPDNSVRFALGWDFPFEPTGGGIYGPASDQQLGPLIINVFTEGIFVPATPNCSPFGGCDPGQGAFIGSVVISEAQKVDLFEGRWYAAFTSAAYPNGEIRAQIPAVPEPSTLSLILFSGAIVFGLFRAKTLLRA
ncbi:MAG: CHRD domain-containing protein [Verrucomicrobiota bacterium]